MRLSSDHTARIASVLKMLPKIVESMSVAAMARGLSSEGECRRAQARYFALPAMPSRIMVIVSFFTRDAISSCTGSIAFIHISFSAGVGV